MENTYSSKTNIQKQPLSPNGQYKMVSIRGIVVFPGQTTHIDVARNKTLEAINKALEADEEIFLVMQKNASNANPAPKDIHRVGTLARIQQVIKLPNDHMRVLVTGVSRMEIVSYVQLMPYFVVELNQFPYEKDDEIMVEAVKRNLLTLSDKFKQLDARIGGDLANMLNENELEKFIYTIAPIIYRNDSGKQNLLQLRSIYAQLEDILVQLAKESEIIELERKIATEVRKSIDKNQREYFLREQIKAIKTELGEDEDEIEGYKKQIIDKNLPEYVVQKLEKEISRMDKMSPQSPEAGVIRTYIEWVLDLPWTQEATDNFDLEKARQILDEDHFGLTKVKERIIEYLAVLKLNKRNNQTNKAPILCFVGPPGVGKTSIVYSIARAVDKKLVTMSLGGVRDEAEIRGHRRTYIGSMPGRIISAMKNANVNNPVFLLDEIDKMSSDFRGDPSSALLEVLDPNQNFNFKDHYIEIPFDLSKVMFVTTANSIDTISPPLLDRMEIIEISGYTYQEKLQIAKKYLVKKQLKQNALDSESVEFTDDAINKIINSYTRESGVRNLEREIGSVCRKIAVKTLENLPKHPEKVKKFKKPQKYLVQKDDIANYLGAERFIKDETIKDDEVGLATGLAWTSVGGTTLNIEVALIKGGKGEIILTGSLGDVMKESCQTAMTLVRNRMEKFNIDPEILNNYNIHIHFPEGATPKDGPSAGITIATALLSAMSNRKVRANVAMTGEVTLRGRVLAIGGLKEKSLAAYRLGIKKLIIPKENKKDVPELPKEVTDALEIVLADNIDTVFTHAII